MIMIDDLFRIRPWRAEDDSVIFNGWARMALPIQVKKWIFISRKRESIREKSKI